MHVIKRGVLSGGKTRKRAIDPRSFGSQCIRETEESTLGKVPLMHRDPNDLGPMIRFRILPKSKRHPGLTLTKYLFHIYLLLCLYQDGSCSKFEQCVQKLFTKNLLTAGKLLACYWKHLRVVIQFSKWPRDEIPKYFTRNLMSNFVGMLKASVIVFNAKRPF